MIVDVSFQPKADQPPAEVTFSASMIITMVAHISTQFPMSSNTCRDSECASGSKNDIAIPNPTSIIVCGILVLEETTAAANIMAKKIGIAYCESGRPSITVNQKPSRENITRVGRGRCA